MKRDNISRAMRFEILKRDSFTCQYCGRYAPDIVLEIDHIQPVACDGDNDITNLITSCFDCNRGKRDRELSDDTVVKKRKVQLDMLQMRREQIEMMLEWQIGLVDIEANEVDALSSLFMELTRGKFSISDHGRTLAKRMIKKYGLEEIMECARSSITQYLELDDNGDIKKDTVYKSFDCIEKIASYRRRISDKPYLRDLYYIRGIVRNRLNCIDYVAIDLLIKAYNNGSEIDDLKIVALDSKNWTEWRGIMEELAKEKE